VAAPAAAEVPVLAYLAIGLLALLSWIVLRGLTSAYRATFGWFLQRLAELLPAKHWYFPVDLRGSIRGVDNAMLHTLGFAASKSEHAAGYFFHGAAVIQEWGWRELRHLARETEGTLDWLAKIHVPKLAKYAFPLALVTSLIYRIVRAELHKVKPQTAKVAHAAAHAATVPFTTTVVIPHLGELRWIHSHWRAIARAAALAAVAPATVALPTVHVLPRIKALERWDGYTRKRLRRLEKLLGVTGFALLMARVLGVSSRCVRSSGPIGRVAKALCGLESDLLAGLLLGLAIVETPISIEELAHEYASVIDDVVKGVGKLVSEVQAHT